MMHINSEKGVSWKCSNAYWGTMLDMALNHGWEPKGTILYKRDLEAIGGQPCDTDELDTDWDGGYHLNNHQTITSDDAANMAVALRKVEIDDWGQNADYVQELIDVLQLGGDIQQY